MMNSYCRPIRKSDYRQRYESALKTAKKYGNAAKTEFFQKKLEEFDRVGQKVVELSKNADVDGISRLNARDIKHIKLAHIVKALKNATLAGEQGAPFIKFLWSAVSCHVGQNYATMLKQKSVKHAIKNDNGGVLSFWLELDPFNVRYNAENYARLRSAAYMKGREQSLKILEKHGMTDETWDAHIIKSKEILCIHSVYPGEAFNAIVELRGYARPGLEI